MRLIIEMNQCFKHFWEFLDCQESFAEMKINGLSLQHSSTFVVPSNENLLQRMEPAVIERYEFGYREGNFYQKHFLEISVYQASDSRNEVMGVSIECFFLQVWSFWLKPKEKNPKLQLRINMK